MALHIPVLTGIYKTMVAIVTLHEQVEHQKKIVEETKEEMKKIKDNYLRNFDELKSHVNHSEKAVIQTMADMQGIIINRIDVGNNHVSERLDKVNDRIDLINDRNANKRPR